MPQSEHFDVLILGSGQGVGPIAAAKPSRRSDRARKGWRAAQAEFAPDFCEERTFLLRSLLREVTGTRRRNPQRAAKQRCLS